MRGVKILDARTVETRDYPRPEAAAGEVVVRVEAAAICGSDLHALYERAGEKPNIPGHEGAGVVVAVGKAARFKEGDRVCMIAFNSCGECEMCRGGYVAYCTGKRSTYGFSCDGFQAEYVRAAEGSLLPLPDSVSFEQAALMVDPVGTPYHAHKRIGTAAGHTVGVFGLGPMGLGAVVTAAHMGARVIGIDPIAYRRELAGKLGAAEVVDPAAGDVVEQIRELTAGRGLDRGLECSGRSDALMAALDLAVPLSHVAIIGENTEATVRPSRHFNHKEITLSGSCCWPLGEYDEIVGLYAAGLRAAEMITHRFSLEQAAEAYAAFAEGNTGKVVFVPNRA